MSYVCTTALGTCDRDRQEERGKDKTRIANTLIHKKGKSKGKG